MDEGTGRYAAFLSYSHRDAAAARWLHRRLETYRIPKRLVGKEGERGPVPKRLTPIFRDREELPAAGDLSERVRAALAASENLIILCSPNAAASPWVAKEIAAFRELHPDRPVFAAIVEGEPSECFPHNLAAGGGEPLAADLRPGHDGRRLGFLKLVAGLSGVGLDALVQRDAQRRIRSVTAVTGAALAAMLVMAVLTGLALSERREAQRQRAEAEGLVEFMLTDLRDRLKGVGRLDVMTAVNARALGYYGARPDLNQLPDDSLARRARVLQAIGDDDFDRDDVDGAFAAYREASRTTGEQLARAPDDPARLFDHAKSDFGIGRVYELRASTKLNGVDIRDWAEARRNYSAFARASAQLITAEPNNPDYLSKAAAAAIDLGNVQFGIKDYAGAQRFYEKSIRLLNLSDTKKPDDRHILLSLANAYGWLADTFYKRNRWQDSLVQRLHQNYVMNRAKERYPGSAEVLFRLAAAKRGLAYSQIKVRDITGARTSFLDAYRVTTRLIRLDPANAEWSKLHERLANEIPTFGLNIPVTNCFPSGT